MRHNRYSSWFNVIDNVTVNTQNLNLTDRIMNLAQAQGWTPATGKKLRAIITIDPGVVVFSTNPASPALTITPGNGLGNFRSYDLIILNNLGEIAGAGGAVGIAGSGGVSNGTDGGVGGTAIRATRNFLLSNQGNIYGGGGGGGGGGGNIRKTYRTRVNRCDQFNGCPGDDTGRCFITGDHNCSADPWAGFDRGPWCTPAGGAVNINSACGSTRLYQESAGTCNVGANVGGNPCTITYNYAFCFTDETMCAPQAPPGPNSGAGPRTGGNGGLGQGYSNALLTLNNTNGTLAANVGTANGANGGGWGTAGSNALNGDTPIGWPGYNANSDILVLPSFGGQGGEAGYWIDGQAFMTLSNGAVGLGRQI